LDESAGYTDNYIPETNKQYCLGKYAYILAAGWMASGHRAAGQCPDQ
jgi:hypothetical protein